MIIVLNIQPKKNINCNYKYRINGEIFSIGNTQNKDHDNSDLIRFYQKTAVQKSYIHKKGICKGNNEKSSKENS